MNFGPRHYVPVLKSKRGEKRALSLIAPAIGRRITPLLEVVERNAERASTVEKHLDTAFAKLADSVRQYRRCFLDAREMEPDGPSAADAVFQRAAAAGMAFTPVTGISRVADVVAALSHRSRGLALRVTRSDFEAGSLGTGLWSFLTQHRLAPEEADLIVDLGAVDDLVAEGVGALTEAFLAEVPDHARWRTFTVSACAFPASMGVVESRSHGLVARADWRAWRSDLHAHRRNLARLPTFSDCAIQHPTGVEGFDPRIMQVSAWVRDTLPEDWLLIKGESTRVRPATEQFPNLATQLVYGHLRSNFAGVDHCAGCVGIKAAADGATGMNSAEVWRRLGTIHHITRVVQDLASLPWP